MASWWNSKKGFLRPVFVKWGRLRRFCFKGNQALKQGLKTFEKSLDIRSNGKSGRTLSCVEHPQKNLGEIFRVSF